MHYLIASKAASTHLPAGAVLLADGEMISFEQPWLLGPPMIARLGEGSDLDALRLQLAANQCNGFVVEGVEEAGGGQAFVLGGHIMRDLERFRPYAAAVPEVVRSFNGRFLARGGAVTPLAGDFVPERVVLIEFPTADDALAFYVSDRYAPLLKVRLATTEARLVLLARTGELPTHIRTAAREYLSRQA